MYTLVDPLSILHTHTFYTRCIHPPTHPFLHQSIHPPMHSPNHAFIHLSIHPSTHPCIHPPTHPPTHSSIHPFIPQTNHPAVAAVDHPAAVAAVEADHTLRHHQVGLNFRLLLDLVSILNLLVLLLVLDSTTHIMLYRKFCQLIIKIPFHHYNKHLLSIRARTYMYY